MSAAIYHMNFLQAIVIGLIQGISELFPISSLGHTVLIPAWIGGTWGLLVRQESSAESPYLAFIVGLHLATAVVLLAFYAREWGRLIVGLLRVVGRREIRRDDERLAVLIVIATVPVGILGIVFEHQFRTLFAKPLAAALFLTANGLILAVGEGRRRVDERRLAAVQPGPASTADAPKERPVSSSALRRLRDDRIVPMDPEAEHQLAGIGMRSGFIIGAAQALALLAGISREGIVMVGGLYRGLNRENAMRFAFLLSTPVILAAGVLKVPDLLGTLGNGIRAQVVAGSIAAVVASLFAVVFLSRYFRTRTLTPFAIYCVLFGLASVVRFGIF